ncbi:MAG: SoxR reducing system RseC family protein [Candidatus Cryptobacteroides sp.]
MKKDQISHTGKIIEITPETTTVEITVSSACASCHAKGMCGVSEEQDKVIVLPTDPYASYKAGDEVYVMLKKSMGMKAVRISYVIPLLILLILVLSLSSVIGNEALTGLAAICGVALYYFVIWLLRDRLSNEFVFYLKEK